MHTLAKALTKATAPKTPGAPSPQQQAKKRPSGDKPPPGYYRAQNSTRGGWTDGTNYWYPSKTKDSETASAPGELPKSGEDEVGDAKSAQAKRQTAHTSLASKHEAEAKNTSNTSTVQEAHRKAHAAHRRAIQQPTNRRASREAFSATNEARAQSRGDS